MFDLYNNFNESSITSRPIFLSNALLQTAFEGLRLYEKMVPLFILTSLLDMIHTAV